MKFDSYYDDNLLPPEVGESAAGAFLTHLSKAIASAMCKKDTELQSTVETPVRWGHGWEGANLWWQKIIIIIGIKLHTLVSTCLILLL